MLYIVQIARNGHDYYGFDCEVGGVAFVDARNKSQARRLAREKLIIAGCGGIKIGRAVYAERHTNAQRLELCLQLEGKRPHIG